MTAAIPHAAKLPPTLRLGTVHLVVTDLGRSLDFYGRGLGLSPHWRDDRRAGLGAGHEDLIVLHEEPGARQPGRHAGLYHVALLYPSRQELARALARLINQRWALAGASDHGTHDALYLDDPDGNGLELAADNPRQLWPDFSNAYSLGPAPLDLQALLASAGEVPASVDPDLVVGHLHIHVGDLDRALEFYRDGLGFEEQMRLSSAAFVSAGGYHHHLAFNLWKGRGVPSAPPSAVGLRHWTILLDEQDQVEEVRQRMDAAGFRSEPAGDGIQLRDPWNIALVVMAAPRPQPRSGAETGP